MTDNQNNHELPESEANHDNIMHRYRPSQAAVDDLISNAKNHELGLDFLRDGAVDAVAATFCVHAYTVHVARDVLANQSR